MARPAAERRHGVPVELAGVRKAYGEHVVLAGVDLRVAPGELLAIVGQSGTGKSVLLRQIVGLERPDAGRITVGGIELGEYLVLPPEEKPFRIAMVFQSSALLASLTVAENVGLRLRERRRHASAEIAAITRRVLEQVELAGTEDQLPGELTGGMRKRAAIARVLRVRAVAPTLGSWPLARRYALYATVRAGQRLDTGADVRRAGIKAGRVEGMRSEHGTVAVRMAIASRFEVKKGSLARLDFRAL